MAGRAEMTRYRPDIDGLRCVAISTVVLSHAGFSWFAGGYVGVDVFFVISGYLITRILWAGLDDYPRSIATFYERRARRILPALMVAVAAVLVAGAVVLGPGAFERLARSAIATTLFVSNVWFWNSSSDYFGADVQVEPLLHTWSLAVEEQFYIVFPLILALTARAGRRYVRPLIAAICMVSFGFAEHALATGRPQAAFYLLQSRAWELGLGALLALTRVPLPGRQVVVEALALAAAAGIIAPVLLYDASTPFPGAAALPPVLGTAVLIWLNAGADSRVKAVLSLRPVVFVGLVSYSLYVWHWPIIVFDRILHGAPTLPRSLACVLLSVLAGAASWYFVERPFRSRSGPLRSRRAVFVVSGASMAAVTAVAAVIWAGGGLPARLPADAARAFAAADDVDPVSVRCRGPRMIGADACRFGATPAGGQADFLLWGDSHAGAVLPGVARAAEAAGKNGFLASKTGCAPLLHVDRLDEGPDHRCADFNDAVLRFLTGRADMPVVILAARWALAAEGTRSDKPGAGALLVDRARDLPSGRVADNFAIFDAGLRATVAAVRATGREVVILGSVPEIGWPVPEAVGEHLLHGTPLPAAPTAADVERRNARVLGVFRDLGDEAGVRVVPVTAAFCDPVCAVVDAEGRPVYSDDDHLSRTGAAGYLAPLLAGLWPPVAAAR